MLTRPWASLRYTYPNSRDDTVSNCVIAFIANTNAHTPSPLCSRYAHQLGLTLPETASAKTEDQALLDAPPEAPARYPLKADEVAGVTADWAGLRAKVAALDPVGRYTVRSIAYRRHLVEDGRCAEPAQAGRCPVAWLFLRPAKFGPPWQLPGQVCLRERGGMIVGDDAVASFQGCLALHTG